MRVVAAIALTAAILVAGASPIVAFDTPAFATATIKYQNGMRKAVMAMKPNPVSLARAFSKMSALNTPYTRYLDSLVPTACQTGAGFRSFKYQANQQGKRLIAGLINISAGNWAGAKRQTSLLVRHYKNMDTIGARIIRECW